MTHEAAQPRIEDERAYLRSCCEDLRGQLVERTKERKAVTERVVELAIESARAVGVKLVRETGGGK